MTESNTPTRDAGPSTRDAGPSTRDAGLSTFPVFRSRFGGLWTDLSNAPELVGGKRELGLISEKQAALLNYWIEHGYVVIEKAVPDEVVDQVNADVERAWLGKLPSIWVEHWEEHTMLIEPARPDLRGKPNKLLDIYGASLAARQAIFSEPIFDFLALIFERPPMAFQSLSFLRGSAQPIHQDTAYVVVNSPLEFAASWIALQDIQPGSGPLEYYDGSHRMKEYLFQGTDKSMPAGSPDHQRFLESLHEQAREMGLERKQFFPRKGDALIWSADLAHGGSQDIVPGSSRHSLVTHYCPVELEPYYVRHAKNSGRVQHQKGAYYCPQARKAFEDL